MKKKKKVYIKLLGTGLLLLFVLQAIAGFKEPNIIVIKSPVGGN